MVLVLEFGLVLEFCKRKNSSNGRPPKAAPSLATNQPVQHFTRSQKPFYCGIHHIASCDFSPPHWMGRREGERGSICPSQVASKQPYLTARPFTWGQGPPPPPRKIACLQARPSAFQAAGALSPRFPSLPSPPLPLCMSFPVTRLSAISHRGELPQH